LANYGDWKDPDVIDIATRTGAKLRDVWKHFGRWIVLAIVALILVLTSYYQVESEEVGVVTRFGAYDRTTEPGLHFKVPLGIERVIKVPVQRQLKHEFGFRTVRADIRTDYERSSAAMDEAIMLTGDLNVADVQWIIQYQIKDAYRYLFKVRSVDKTLRDMSEAAMRQVVGDHSVNEVLTIGREAIQIEAKQQLQRLCDQYGNGIHILQLVLQDVNPPEPVRPAFNEVNEANQERERVINEARAEYNRVIPQARGQAEQTIQEAEGYATERVNRAKGDANRFLALAEEYARAPSVTRTRLHLETASEVVPKAERRIMVDADVKGLLPMLSLDGKPIRTRAAAGGAE
jgi:modulator of FtsH protease HflK